MNIHQIGSYRILSELPGTGLGLTYKAIDPDRDRYVAIKVLRLPRFVEPDFYARFQRYG